MAVSIAGNGYPAAVFGGIGTAAFAFLARKLIQHRSIALWGTGLCAVIAVGGVQSGLSRAADQQAEEARRVKKAEEHRLALLRMPSLLSELDAAINERRWS